MEQQQKERPQRPGYPTETKPPKTREQAWELAEEAREVGTRIRKDERGRAF